ncbi:MAG: hypothetical protein P4L65_10935 [Legionella sp.]|nr:hypothetical protein [Legionella sp.]
MHYKVVIIGAGPIGLYLANKLYQAGVRDMALFDPRAGIYTRPGYVTGSVMVKVKQELKQAPFIVTDGTRVHIKDIERTLYAEIKKLPIPIEKKHFVRFNKDPQNKGIIVADADGQEHLVHCDYAFDCTGSKRLLIKQINALITPQPFTLKPISLEVKVQNHLIAFVKMNPLDYLTTYQSDLSLPSKDPSLEAAFAYAQRIEKLRRFGWYEQGFPRSYGTDFKKGKVCMYFECPDNLPENSKIAWAQSVLETKLHNRNVTLLQLEPSKKYDKKPRVSLFHLDPHLVQQTSYQGSDLPTIIAAGDAQIDPNYVLAHGLETGMIRVDQLINHIKVSNGTIIDFNAKNYTNQIKDLINEQQEMTSSYYKFRASYFINWLLESEHYYRLAIQKASDQPELIKQFTNTLFEIKARKACAKLQMVLSKHYNQHGVLILDDQNAHSLNIDLYTMHILLNQLHAKVSGAQAKLQTEVWNHANTVANLYKDFGKYYFQKKLMNRAVEMYQDARQLYQDRPEYAVQILTLNSNLVLCHRKLNDNDAAITTARTALAQFGTTQELRVMKNKIMCNLITAATDKLSTLPIKEIASFKKDMHLLFSQHPELLDEQMTEDVEHITMQIKESCFSRLSFFRNIFASAQVAPISHQYPPQNPVL